MLPIHISKNVKEQVLFYLESTFEFRGQEEKLAFSRFLTDEEKGIFKGSWLKLSRPFRSADKSYQPPFQFKVENHPYFHQQKAWRLLDTKEDFPKHAIVTTGTGSGKTECFLYPILDHCLREKQKGINGIKAIILYPMNALATDQEKRIAGIIHKDTTLLRSGITVGTYTGWFDPSDPGASEDKGDKEMAPTHGISNHSVLKRNPPDILLTNYRMLDLLLFRPDDQDLWKYNKNKELKFLVLDELHTYEGVQGADVACLIRRLKERLGLEKGDLLCVGTSATIDDKSDLSRLDRDPNNPLDTLETTEDSLSAFASTIFEEDIGSESVISEERMKVEEIITSNDLIDLEIPTDITLLEPDISESEEDYIFRQAKLWKAPELQADLEAWYLSLGKWLITTKLFKYIMEIQEQAEVNREFPLLYDSFIERLSQRELAFGREGLLLEEIKPIMGSFFSLIGRAKIEIFNNKLNLLGIQSQLWIRELRRVGKVLSTNTDYSWLDEPTPGIKSFPAFHCRECGETGWVGLIDITKEDSVTSKGVKGFALVEDPNSVYRAWFQTNRTRSKHIVILSKRLDISAYENSKDHPLYKLFPDSLVVREGDGDCPLSGSTNGFFVKANFDTEDKDGFAVGAQKCPQCESRESVLFIGAQSATISSVALDEMFSSNLNPEPKLLAFTDSVQDASHRAGFFSSRTYSFTLRAGLQHAIEANNGNLLLDNSVEHLLSYWSEKKAGRPGSLKKALSIFVPYDLQNYQPYLDFRNRESLENIPPNVKKELYSRIRWEIQSEFGFMQTHGRTLEASGSSALGWKQEIIDKTISLLKSRMPSISPTLTGLDDKKLKLYLYGFLHRYKLKGAVYHEYLTSLAANDFWGKLPFGKAIPERETYPPAKYIRPANAEPYILKPRLIVTNFKKGHEYVLSSSKTGPLAWHLVWFYRLFPDFERDDLVVLDLIRLLLTEGVKSGLFVLVQEDSTTSYYAISTSAAYLTSNIVLLRTPNDHLLVRPFEEAENWIGIPSIEHTDKEGKYTISTPSRRQNYYLARYKKGALRRIVASEHTGLLNSTDRINLEKSFISSKHLDDPNVLTCTSTMEMGINIGDLSSTMLCSIPPNTSNYLQRIGRAGRKSGSSFIIAIVNQRPHDLFFYARPLAMLKGKIETPGCWLDASAVLARQYLAYCLDEAGKLQVLTNIPSTVKQFLDDWKDKNGKLQTFFAWIIQNETALQNKFLSHFQTGVSEETKDKFRIETKCENILQKIDSLSNSLHMEKRELENAAAKVKSQIKTIHESEEELKLELEEELSILQTRSRNLSRKYLLELLTENGLLPNYAFPEKGVGFYGTTFNKNRDTSQKQNSVELTRPASSAIKELAPSNHFYTHGKQFQIQQLFIGSKTDTLIEKFGICGNCGHLRNVELISHTEENKHCPQCGHGGDDKSQSDLGQQKDFLEFSRSKALSYVEYYESLSGDRAEERERAYYKTARVFDETTEEATNTAWINQREGFGIEFRPSMLMRDLNSGYASDLSELSAGQDLILSEKGFQVCEECGIVLLDGVKPEKIKHRRSCSIYQKFEIAKFQGKVFDQFKWRNIYLYRKLQSECIRILIPFLEIQEVETLKACLSLGIRIKLKGNPATIIIDNQMIPGNETNPIKNYLILMDTVPGGTGYLKTLFEKKDKEERGAEGIMEILRFAKQSLETCECRHLTQKKDESDTDGCYRCIRSYQLQYSHKHISRELGIRLLDRLLELGSHRQNATSFSEINQDKMFESVLEKNFIDKLKTFCEKELYWKWEKTIVNGKNGFRTTKLSSNKNHLVWEIEIQPELSFNEGVKERCRPDFLFTCKTVSCKPIAIFLDGFEFHCNPNNRLADDFKKRNSILESGNFYVWNITWDDLEKEELNYWIMKDSQSLNFFRQNCKSLQSKYKIDILNLLRDSFTQFKEVLQKPEALTESKGNEKKLPDAIYFLLKVQVQFLNSSKLSIASDKVNSYLTAWLQGSSTSEVQPKEEIYSIVNNFQEWKDFLFLFESIEIANQNIAGTMLCRLDDRDESVTSPEFKQRWRNILGNANLFQFLKNFKIIPVSNYKPEHLEELVENLSEEETISSDWQKIIDDSLSSLKNLLTEFAESKIPCPESEYFLPSSKEELFAEYAWILPEKKVVFLAGEQIPTKNTWIESGYVVITLEDVYKNGIDFFKDLFN